jgi:TetR/AcrR family transcriptional regulator, transcriptional repressor of bet genes
MTRASNTDDRRAQIVDALIAVMAKHGYDGASIGDIARKAGLAPGLVHYHFDNKLEILLEAVRKIAAEHDRALDAALADINDPRRALATFIDVHLGLGAHANPTALACWVLIIGESLREKRVRAEVELVLARLTMRINDILMRGITTKVFDCDVDAAAAGILATIQGYFTLAASSRALIPPGTAASTTLQMVEGLVGARLGHRERKAR